MFLIIPGQTICFNIFIADDNIAEISESFGVQLIDRINGILLESPVVHIRDDDKGTRQHLPMDWSILFIVEHITSIGYSLHIQLLYSRSVSMWWTRGLVLWVSV